MLQVERDVFDLQHLSAMVTFYVVPRTARGTVRSRSERDTSSTGACRASRRRGFVLPCGQ
jgi:hypothetical protein